MDGPLRFPRLRIAASAVCLVLGALLIVLWIRSYYRGDTIVWGLTDKRGFLVDTSNGVLLLIYFHDIGDQVNLSRWWMERGPPADFLNSWNIPTEPY